MSDVPGSAQIAHVLLVDAVGFSLQTATSQAKTVAQLTAAVTQTETFQQARAARSVHPISTGDGMALVFLTDVTAPARCAVEVDRALRASAGPAVRMGIHSGLAQRQIDVAGNANFLGEGINTAQRVMGLGESGQILMSSQYANWLLQFEEWVPRVRRMGAHQAKHGLVIEVYALVCVGPAASDGPGELACPIPDAGQANQAYVADTGRERLGSSHVVHRTHPSGSPPKPPTPLIGRAREFSDVTGLLSDDEVRLLTLVGTGGIGKTRLALELAWQRESDHPGSVLYAELDRVQDAQTVPATLAGTLGVLLPSGVAPAEQLGRALLGRSLLLVCDSFEHVMEAAGFLGDLLRVAPRLQCLVTSRRPLGLQGERVYQVGPLPVPPEDCPPGDLARYDSVRLFSARATDSHLGWGVTADNAPAVGELCRRLEGLPLCLELAAARLRGTTLQELLADLQDRFRTLSGSRPDLPPRHQTLRAALDWSYHLLTPDQRALLAQLSVFRGGFFREAAEAVTDHISARELIFDLHWHSLLNAREAGGRTRYGMLEAVREYAAEWLARADPELAEGAQSRHAMYFCVRAEELARQMPPAQAREAAAEMSLELENCRAALDWAANRSDEVCARLAHALLWLTGSSAEALDWGRRGLEAAQRAGNAHLRADLLRLLAVRMMELGDLTEVREWVEEALELSRRSQDLTGEGKALSLRGRIATEFEQWDQAAKYLQLALSLWVRLDDREAMAYVRRDIGLLARAQGDHHSAEQHLRGALDIGRDLGDLQVIEDATYQLGVLAELAKDWKAARMYNAECLAACLKLSRPEAVARTLFNIGRVAVGEGRFHVAVVLLTGAVSALRRVGSRWVRDCEHHLELLRQHPEFELSAEELEAAQATPWDEVLAQATAYVAQPW